jgi:hypothetical protein
MELAHPLAPRTLAFPLVPELQVSTCRQTIGAAKPLAGENDHIH